MPAESPTEYHVVYAAEPYPRWEVSWKGKRMGFEAWDKRVATSAAKELANSLELWQLADCTNSPKMPKINNLRMLCPNS